MNGSERPIAKAYAPDPARVYDYLFDQKNCYTADRKFGERLLQACPTLQASLWQAHQWVQQSAAMLAADGFTQFVDLGTGIPRVPYLHDTIRAVAPTARVVYVDWDPVVRAHAAALMVRSSGVEFAQVDITDAEDLRHPDKLPQFLDLSIPAVVILESTLEFLSGAKDVVAQLSELFAPGSLLVISHMGSNDVSSRIDQIQKVFDEAGIGFFPRSRDELVTILGGPYFTAADVAPTSAAPVVEPTAKEKPIGASAAQQVAFFGVVARITGARGSEAVSLLHDVVVEAEMAAHQGSWI
ncbi:SAM-dependent methyltransferase [Nocardia tengchongensis]|uniref:SAM-dependent methyltransferase n=1 Tax=Nocardia tengchongensis TaxID=2055889 RepID=UPI0036A0F0FF